MVLPLIPAAFIAVGALTGGGGLALGGKGALDLKKSSEKIKASLAQQAERHTRGNEQISATNEVLATYGQQQEQALVDVLVRMAAFLKRNEKQVRESERLLVDGIGVDTTRVAGLANFDIDAKSWVLGAIGSATVAGGTATAIPTAVASLGAASTGTAISGLSGAAAQSATMAWMGGGAVAAGGGGVAMGVVALNFVTFGPAILMGGMVTKTQGKKAVTRAQKTHAEVEVACAELDLRDAKLEGVCDRVAELSTLLAQVSERAVATLDELESEPFHAYAHAARFQRSRSLVMATRAIVATVIVDEGGDLTAESASLTIKYRPMTEDTNHD